MIEIFDFFTYFIKVVTNSRFFKSPRILGLFSFILLVCIAGVVQDSFSGEKVGISQEIESVKKRLEKESNSSDPKVVETYSKYLETLNALKAAVPMSLSCEQKAPSVSEILIDSDATQNFLTLIQSGKNLFHPSTSLLSIYRLADFIEAQRSKWEPPGEPKKFEMETTEGEKFTIKIELDENKNIYLNLQSQYSENSEEVAF